MSDTAYYANNTAELANEEKSIKSFTEDSQEKCGKGLNQSFLKFSPDSLVSLFQDIHKRSSIFFKKNQSYLQHNLELFTHKL